MISLSGVCDSDMAFSVLNRIYFAVDKLGLLYSGFCLKKCGALTSSFDQACVAATRAFQSCGGFCFLGLPWFFLELGSLVFALELFLLLRVNRELAFVTDLLLIEHECGF